jgi:hypothetical protein
MAPATGADGLKMLEIASGVYRASQLGQTVTDF